MWSAEKVREGKPALTLVSKGNANSGQGDSADCHAETFKIHPELSGVDESPWIAECGVEAVQTGSLLDGSDNERIRHGQHDRRRKWRHLLLLTRAARRLQGNHRPDEPLRLPRRKAPVCDDCRTVWNARKPLLFCRNAPITRFQVSPDDSHAAFVTSDQITSYNTKDPNGPCSFGGTAYDGEGYGDPPKRTLNERCQEMYSYDPSTGKIVCVSCNPSGAPPTHDVSASTQGLFMSNDGRTFFSTEESLTQTDTNEAMDVYEYTEGRPQLITTGTDAADKAGSSEEGVTGIHGGLAGVSADGVNVYFSTRDTLVPQDENGQYIKFYDARTDGGFPFEKPAPPCESADECHGAGSSTPSFHPRRNRPLSSVPAAMPPPNPSPTTRIATGTSVRASGTTLVPTRVITPEAAPRQ